MTKELPRVVVDTCVLLDFLLDLDPELQKRARSILDGHEKRHLVVIPAIVLAEVAGAGAVRGSEGGKEAREARIAKVMGWIDSSGFIVAELSEDLARKASKLATIHDLKGPDAVVLATALKWSRTLFTRDNGLLKVDISELAIVEPSMPEEEFSLLTSTGEVLEF